MKLPEKDAAGKRSRDAGMAEPGVSLRPMTLDTATDVLSGLRRGDWAEGYPTPGDMDVARIVLERSRTGRKIGHEAFHPHQILLGDSLVVGGIGCHQPPERDTVEVGYGIAPEHQRKGICTEALSQLLEKLASAGVKVVLARTDLHNFASQRVLARNGFSATRTDGDFLVWEKSLVAARR